MSEPGEIAVAYLTGEYPRATDTFIQREVAALREKGARVETFSIRAPRSKDRSSGTSEAEERARTFYVLSSGTWCFVRAHARLAFTRPIRYLSTLWTALTVRAPGLRSFVFQLIYFAEAGVVGERLLARGIRHLHNHFANSSCSVAMLASQVSGVSFSVTVHGPAIFFEPDRWKLGEKARRALFVSCISHFCRSQVMIFSPVETWSRLHIVHCGVRPEDYAPKQHEGDARRIVYVGRLAAVKGLPMLIEAFARLRPAHPQLQLDLVGDGPDRAALERRAQDLGVSDAVVFHGYRSPLEVRDHLRDADIFVMSSFAEGVPVVLMEAMASGLPVVATRVAGVSELVEDGVSGFTVPPGDVESLTERIDAFVQDATLRTRFGREGRAKVEREFNIEWESQRLRDILVARLEGRQPETRPAVEAELQR